MLVAVRLQYIFLLSKVMLAYYKLPFNKLAHNENYGFFVFWGK